MIITKVDNGYRISDNFKSIVLTGYDMCRLFHFWLDVIYKEDYNILLEEDEDVVSDIAEVTSKSDDFKEEVIERYTVAMEDVINDNWRETLEDCIYETIKRYEKRRKA